MVEHRLGFGLIMIRAHHSKTAGLVAVLVIFDSIFATSLTMPTNDLRLSGFKLTMELAGLAAHTSGLVGMLRILLLLLLRLVLVQAVLVRTMQYESANHLI